MKVMPEKGPVRRLFSLLTSGRGFASFDLGVLKVGLMLAAVDGRVVEREIAIFKRIARKCPGWSAEATEEILEDGLHAAGYLLIQSHRLNERQLIAAFVREAHKALPFGFASSGIHDLRRAFIMWGLMVGADLKASMVEAKAVLALRDACKLKDRIPDSFLREIERQFLRLGEEATCLEALKMFKTFIDVGDLDC